MQSEQWDSSFAAEKPNSFKELSYFRISEEDELMMENLDLAEEELLVNSELVVQADCEIRMPAWKSILQRLHIDVSFSEGVTNWTTCVLYILEGFNWLDVGLLFEAELKSAARVC